MKPVPAPARPDPAAGAGLARGIALGFLAMLPLFALYEIAASRGAARNLAELFVLLPLAPLGEGVVLARRILLGVLAGAALVHVFRSGLGLLPRLWRIFLEGLLGAVLIGPALLGLLWLLGASPDRGGLPIPHPGPAPRLAQAAFLMGGSAWEEIVFRVGLQSLFYLFALHALRFLTENEPLTRAGADLLAIPAAALVFAAAHLAVVVQLLGAGGEPFDRAVFTWRCLAGILLGALFRWRGPGVAAWTHALFNLLLVIGAGPDVFL